MKSMKNNKADEAITEVDSFLKHLEFLENNSSIDEALDYMYRVFDENLLAGQFKLCNQILENAQVDKFNASVLLGFLVITVPWKLSLNERPKFYKRVEKKFRVDYPKEKTERLLKGLE